MSEAPWQCPRCYELGRTPVRLEIGRGDLPPVLLVAGNGEVPGYVTVTVCLRCADVLWHRLRKVVGPLVREAETREAAVGHS